ncbi:hypothetical protein [Bacillus safensis]|uniref:hypothetical protein n=1 Tax=Bacillus safensis TaxID=561879 RepID=UPI001CD5CB51|nr:hypothetical protein [Bacillus safensis]
MSEMNKQDMENLTLLAINYALEEDSSTRESRERILTAEFAEENAMSEPKEYKILLHRFQKEGVIEGILFHGPTNKPDKCVLFEKGTIKVTPYGKGLVEKYDRKYFK